VKMRKAEFCSEIAPKNAPLDASNGQALITYIWEKSKRVTAQDTVTVEGIYKVTLTNQFNCKLKDSINVMDNCPPIVYLPNAITPGSNNGDKAYKVFGRNFTNFQILVFSRWGEVIYKSNDRYEVWDGTYRGEPMPIGVYPYVITFEGDSETYKEQQSRQGTITIVR
jgi:gliding motility-associated-like protein